MSAPYFPAVIWALVLLAIGLLLWLERDRIGEHIPHFAAAWHWSRGKRLHALAAVFAGGEGIIECGLPLPYADAIDQRLRILIIAAIVGLAYYLKWRADQEPRDA